MPAFGIGEAGVLLIWIAAAMIAAGHDCCCPVLLQVRALSGFMLTRTIAGNLGYPICIASKRIEFFMEERKLAIYPKMQGH